MIYVMKMMKKILLQLKQEAIDKRRCKMSEL
jgi:hypothetical protein